MVPFNDEGVSWRTRDDASHMRVEFDIARNWALVEKDTIALAEGQNKGAYKSNVSNTWDTIHLTAGQLIAFGNKYVFGNEIHQTPQVKHLRQGEETLEQRQPVNSQREEDHQLSFAGAE